ncbi:MAG TPA: HD domain-containing protein [Anaerolineales bacterium]
MAPVLCYHCLAHTKEGVVPSTERLALLENVDGIELELLLTAAYFHDIGFVENGDRHEEIGARIAAEALAQFNFGSEHIQRIQSMILATRLPQSPDDILEAILADADLDVLGRDDFLLKSLELKDELEALGESHSDAEWYRRQLGFLESHHFWTQSAKMLRDAKKRENIALLKQLLAQAQSDQHAE